jgi:hypothetical protein
MPSERMRLWVALIRCLAPLRLSIASSRTVSWSATSEVYGRGSSDHAIVSPSRPHTPTGRCWAGGQSKSLEFTFDNRENPYMFRDAMLTLLLAENTALSETNRRFVASLVAFRADSGQVFGENPNIVRGLGFLQSCSQVLFGIPPSKPF